MTPGLGFNKTSINLDDHGYGTLKSLNVETDSKTADMLKAVAELLPVVLPPAGGQRDFAPQDGRTLAKCEVEGHNVPVGYYEAVLNPGPDGKKRLCGWRYIGFAPFASCSTEGLGDSSVPNAGSELYGLITVGNCMVFRRLSDIAKESKVECPVVVPKPESTPKAAGFGQSDGSISRLCFRPIAARRRRRLTVDRAALPPAVGRRTAAKQPICPLPPRLVAGWRPPPTGLRRGCHQARGGAALESWSQHNQMPTSFRRQPPGSYIPPRYRRVTGTHKPPAGLDIIGGLPSARILVAAEPYLGSANRCILGRAILVTVSQQAFTDPVSAMQTTIANAQVVFRNVSPRMANS